MKSTKREPILIVEEPVEEQPDISLDYNAVNEALAALKSDFDSKFGQKMTFVKRVVTEQKYRAKQQIIVEQEMQIEQYIKQKSSYQIDGQVTFSMLNPQFIK